MSWSVPGRLIKGGSISFTTTMTPFDVAFVSVMPFINIGMSSVSSPHSLAVGKASIKSLDKELDTLKNRIRRLELQESNAQALERVTNKKMAQLVSKKMIVEEMLPLKHKDREGIVAEIESRKWENQQTRAEREGEVRNIKQALYMVKRDRARELYLQKIQNRSLIQENKRDIIRSNQDRYQQIKHFKSHEKYLEFMRGKLIKARIYENLDNYEKQRTESHKIEQIKLLKEEENMLKQRAQRSSSRTLEAKKQYAAVEQLPRNKLLSEIKRTIDPKSLNQIKLQSSNRNQTRSLDVKKDRYPRTTLVNQSSFEKILKALRKKNSGS